MLKNLFNRLLSTPSSPSTAPAAEAAAAPGAARSHDDVASADALIAEGNELEDAGQLEQAEARYLRAADLAPGHARAHLNVGIVRAARDDAGGAIAAYERTLQIEPAHAFGNYNYARLALLRGELALARRLIATALRTKPDFPQALVVQSNVLDALDEPQAALAALEAALRLQPGDAGAWFNLGALQRRLGRPDEARDAAERALALDPGRLDALALQARAMREQGFAGEALPPLRRALASTPQDWPLRSLELLLMLFADDLPADAIFQRHAEFGADLERAVPVRFDRWPERGDPRRRLRIGYVSGDLCLHPVAFFLMPVLEQHDRTQVEVFCYSYGARQDPVSARLKAMSDHWREARDLSDEALADAIHADAIDVLVDLGGHSGQPRLGVFSQRPAPVQASWVGYLNTTGLTRIDFRLCDGRTDPLATAQPRHTERLLHLPVSQWCYRPMVDEPLEPVAPFERNGHLTFGSFNAALKVTPATCRHWGDVLAQVPDSRLIVANVDSQRKRAAIRGAIEGRGVAAERIEFLPRVPLNEYLPLYDAVDIVLDTLPYGGGTTTFDALWMGVPVVTAIGDTSVSRSGASILEEVGLDDWIAPSVDAYVDVAVARAGEREALAALRRTLRDRLQASPITDSARFVRDLEAACREMWLARGA